jgi:hypothetical protein
MAYGVRKLRKLQFVREAVAGTPLAATDIWRGPANMPEDTRVITKVEEDTGQLTPGDRTVTTMYGAQLVLESTPATYQHLPHIFEGGINAEVATADGAGTDFIREYVIGESTNAVKTYLWEGGDNSDAGEMEYSFVTDFVIAGNSGETVNLESATWKARQYTDAAFTGGLTLDTVEEIVFAKGKLYIDADGGAFGGTQVTGELLGFSLNVTTGWQAIPVGDGNLYFCSVKNVGPTAQLELTLEHSTAAVAERANWRTQTVRKVRLIFEGSAFGTAGTTYTYHTLIIDIRGKWSAVSTLDDQDGDNVVTLTLDMSDDTTTAESKIIVVNEIAAL